MLASLPVVCLCLFDQIKNIFARLIHSHLNSLGKALLRRSFSYFRRQVLLWLSPETVDNYCCLPATPLHCRWKGTKVALGSMSSAEFTIASNMLRLLLLLTACFSLCLAQTMSFTTDQMHSATTAPSFSSLQPTSVVPTDNLDFLAILQTVVKSTHELNTTSLNPVLDQISNMIREIQPDAMFKLTVTSITEV